MNLEERKKRVKSILVTLPKPENDKNPYAELAKKLNLKIDFIKSANGNLPPIHPNQANLR